MTEVFDCSDGGPARRWASRRRSARSGRKLVVMPTDTVYGIGADAFDAPAVPRCWPRRGAAPTCRCRCWSGRGTPSTAWCTRVPPAARELIRAFWPGALSLVVRQAPSLQWDLGDAPGTVMLRMPLHPVALELLREVGPMAVSSANISGQARRRHRGRGPRSTRRPRRGLPRGGPSAQQAASTIVDLTGAQPRMLREGPVTTTSRRCSASRPSHSPAVAVSYVQTRQ